MLIEVKVKACSNGNVPAGSFIAINTDEIVYTVASKFKKYELDEMQLAVNGYMKSLWGKEDMQVMDTTDGDVKLILRNGDEVTLEAKYYQEFLRRGGAYKRWAPDAR